MSNPALTGTIPPQLGNAPNLLALQLKSTGIGGTVPSEGCSLVGPTEITSWIDHRTGVDRRLRRCRVLVRLSLPGGPARRGRLD